MTTPHVQDPPDDGAGAGASSWRSSTPRATGGSSRSSRGVFGIFGHGNVAGHRPGAAEARTGFATTCRATSRRWCTPPSAFAKMRTGCGRWPAPRSIGPGATNMVTGAARRDDQPAAGAAAARRHLRARRAGARAAAARIDRSSQDVSVNDCFKPVSRYWDRINRPEQILTALPEAMRVLTSPAETGAVTLGAAAGRADRSVRLSRRRSSSRASGRIPRRAAGRAAAARSRAADSRQPHAPLIVAGGGVIYSEATDALRAFAEATGIAGRRDAGGQRRAALRSSARARRDRRHRHARPPTGSRATPTS